MAVPKCKCGFSCELSFIEGEKRWWCLNCLWEEVSQLRFTADLQRRALASANKTVATAENMALTLINARKVTDDLPRDIRILEMERDLRRMYSEPG